MSSYWCWVVPVFPTQMKELHYLCHSHYMRLCQHPRLTYSRPVPSVSSLSSYFFHSTLTTMSKQNIFALFLHSLYRGYSSHLVCWLLYYRRQLKTLLFLTDVSTQLPPPLNILKKFLYISKGLSIFCFVSIENLTSIMFSRGILPSTS